MKVTHVIISVLLLVIGAGAYKFIIKGSVAKGSDSRTAILLKAEERNFILGEMRGLLSKTQQLVSALANDDMPKFIQIAKVLKDESAGEIQQSLLGKMPFAFKQMSFKIYDDFKQIYETAVAKKDQATSLKQVANLMTNCVACHATYSLREERNQK